MSIYGILFTCSNGQSVFKYYQCLYISDLNLYDIFQPLFFFFFFFFLIRNVNSLTLLHPYDVLDVHRGSTTLTSPPPSHPYDVLNVCWIFFFFLFFFFNTRKKYF